MIERAQAVAARIPDCMVANSAMFSILTADLLTTEQVSQIIGVTKWTLASWREQRQGPPFLRRTRGTIRYSRAALESWLRAQRNYLRKGIEKGKG